MTAMKRATTVSRDIAINKGLFPSLPAGEFYWHQLEGLTVHTVYGQSANNSERQNLGVVKHMLETGANDVLVVKGKAGSLDRNERLIPYTKQHVLNVDLAAGEIEVDWDPDF